MAHTRALAPGLLLFAAAALLQGCSVWKERDVSPHAAPRQASAPRLTQSQQKEVEKATELEKVDPELMGKIDNLKLLAHRHNRANEDKKESLKRLNEAQIALAAAEKRAKQHKEEAARKKKAEEERIRKQAAKKRAELAAAEKAREEAEVARKKAVEQRRRREEQAAAELAQTLAEQVRARAAAVKALKDGIRHARMARQVALMKAEEAQTRKDEEARRKILAEAERIKTDEEQLQSKLRVAEAERVEVDEVSKAAISAFEEAHRRAEDAQRKVETARAQIQQLKEQQARDRKKALQLAASRNSTEEARMASARAAKAKKIDADLNRLEAELEQKRKDVMRANKKKIEHAKKLVEMFRRRAKTAKDKNLLVPTLVNLIKQLTYQKIVEKAVLYQNQVREDEPATTKSLLRLMKIRLQLEKLRRRLAREKRAELAKDVATEDKASKEVDETIRKDREQAASLATYSPSLGALLKETEAREKEQKAILDAAKLQNKGSAHIKSLAKALERIRLKKSKIQAEMAVAKEFPKAPKDLDIEDFPEVKEARQKVQKLKDLYKDDSDSVSEISSMLQRLQSLVADKEKLDLRDAHRKKHKAREKFLVSSDLGKAESSKFQVSSMVMFCGLGGLTLLVLGLVIGFVVRLGRSTQLQDSRNLFRLIATEEEDCGPGDTTLDGSDLE